MTKFDLLGMIGHFGKGDIGMEQMVDAVDTYTSAIIEQSISGRSEQLPRDYWQVRCALAEKFISESPCDPDITKEQTEAWAKYQDFIKSSWRQLPLTHARNKK